MGFQESPGVRCFLFQGYSFGLGGISEFSEICESLRDSSELSSGRFPSSRCCYGRCARLRSIKLFVGPAGAFAHRIQRIGGHVVRCVGLCFIKLFLGPGVIWVLKLHLESRPKPIILVGTARRSPNWGLGGWEGGEAQGGEVRRGYILAKVGARVFGRSQL